MRTRITQNEKMQLLGLLTLAQRQYKLEKLATDAIDEILEDEEHFSLLSDAVYEEDTDIDKILKDMGIEVNDAAA